MKVIQDVCLKYACDCTVKTATKPPQPIEKSTAGASLLAQVIVAKWADHQPLHRQEKMFERHGIEISRKTMGGWMAQCAELLDPLYQLMKKELFELQGDRHRRYQREGAGPQTSLRQDRTDLAVCRRCAPSGDRVRLHARRERAPARRNFWKDTKGICRRTPTPSTTHFSSPQRGMTEVGCWMHARRYLFKALESDEPHMGPALHLIARLYAVEERAKALSLSAEQRLALRQRVSARLIGQAPPVSAGAAAGGSAEESVRRRGALCAESVGGADALSGRRRVGDRQRRHGTGQPRHRAGPRQLDLLRQRQRRQDGGGAAKLHRFLQAVRRRAVCLVPRRALAHPGALHHPAERTASPQLEADDFPIPGLGNPPILHVQDRQAAVYETLTLIYDKFHIIQHANDAVDEVRRAEFFRKGRKMRDLIKGKKWLLLSRWKNLAPRQRGVLNRLFQLNRRVFKAYMLKESLERLWDYRYEGAMVNYLGKWMDQLRWQRLPSFQKLAAMLIKHLDGILNYCRTKVRFGVVEAVNGNIRMLINRGRGYQNLRYLLLKAKRMAVTNIEFIAVHTVKKAA